jgi:hypothetical protein
MKNIILTLIFLVTIQMLTAQTFNFADSSYQYNVQQIPYSIYNLPQSTPATVNDDDSYSAGIPLNYVFNFFGTTYSELAIGSNGNISFNASDFSQYDQWDIPNVSLPSNDLPKNNIFGVYQDIYDLSNTNGTMAYGYIGTTPFRKFVTFYDNVPLYSCNSTTMTNQIVLYETYNFIDVQVDERTPCTTWNNGNGVIGIQNVDASLAFYPPNRNVGNWTADDEAWRFRPTSTLPDFQYILCDANLDGVETFDTNVILTHFAATGQTVSIHLTQDDADNNVNPITGNYNNITNAQTLFVRIDDGTYYVIKHVLLAAIDCNADYDIDGVPTNNEDLNGNGNYGDDDTDGDGIPDFVDDDDDGDMILTNYELIISRPNGRSINNYADTDGDGTPNYLDNDDDGDGTLTIYEDYNGDGNPANDDTNNNSIPDYLESQVTAGISQLPDSAISLYPNPSKGILNIAANIDIQFMIVKIYASDGKLIRSLDFNQLTNTSIAMPKVKGIYLVRIQTDKGLMQKSIIRE